jgi:tetratricopeptide (TPR) repeat protein
VRVLITGAWSELETRGLTSAIAMLEEARRRAGTLGDDVLLALSRVQEGVVLAHAGDWDAAISALGLVGDGAAALTPAQRCAFHINLGLALTGAGRIAEAAAALETARDLAHDHGFVEQEFKARHNLACLAFVDGDLPRALVLMREADEMTATVARDRARLDHAEVLLAAGLVDGARSALEDALTGAQRQGHRLEEGEISLRLARCDLLVGDLGGSRRHVGQALAAYRSRQADELVLEAQLIRHTLDVAEGHDLPSVVTALARRTDRGASAASTRPSDRAALRLEAEARITLGDLDGAERRLAALDGSDESSLAATLHDVLVRARLDRARGRAAEAVARLEAGNRILAAHQFQSASLDVRAALALHGRRLSALDVERSLAEDGPDGVLGTVERWRAISHRINPVTPPADSELADATRELRRLRRISADSDPDTAATLAPRIGDLEAQVAHREWSLAVHGSGADPSNPVAPEEAHAAVAAAGATAVEFVEAGELLVQLVVRPTGTEVVDVGTVAEVVGAVTRLRRDLRARAGVSAASPMAAALERATASSLAAVDRLLNPSGASDGRVVLVPSHSLAGMPWSLMPSLRGRPVTTAPSLTRWVRGPAAPADARRLGVAALHGPGLGRTAPEIRSVLAAHGSPVPVEVHPASSEEVLTALGSTRIVHLAAHGTHQGQSPLFSSLRMADGPLFAHEFPRPVAAEHVVLSACDVGQFSTRAGDEPLGLAIALLALGATSVLAAVAPVADDVAHDAMVAYHRMIAAGTDAAEALAVVVEGEPAAGVFCLYGSDWAVGDTEGVR